MPKIEEGSINLSGKIYTARMVTLGGDADLIEQSFNQNGTYEASDYDADGFSKVEINVSVVSKLPQVIDGTITELTASDLEGATKIKDYGLYRQTTLTSITIPDSVTSIGTYAFENCSGLTSIVIPDSVTSIGTYAFNYCSSLTSITIPDSVTSIGSSVFRDCSSLTSVTIGNGITSISSYAFGYCSGITSVTIPDSVTSIGNYAFRDCSSLTSITMKRLTPPTIQTTTFNAVPSNATIIVPKGSLNAYKTATNWSTRADYIVEADE